MRHLLTFAVLVALVCSCATQKNLPSVVTAQDSVRTEIRTEIVERIDTVFVSLPPQKSERTTTDTTSTLENDYATSTATILPGGFLYHDLRTKPLPVPVPVVDRTERTDSVRIEYVEKPVPYAEPVYIEKELPHWQKFCLKCFWPFLFAILMMAGLRLRKPLCALARIVLRR